VVFEFYGHHPSGISRWEGGRFCCHSFFKVGLTIFTYQRLDSNSKPMNSLSVMLGRGPRLWGFFDGRYTLLVGLPPSSLGASHQKIPSAAGLPLYIRKGTTAFMVIVNRASFPYSPLTLYSLNTRKEDRGKVTTPKCNSDFFQTYIKATVNTSQ
jgi:hypothetical protein